MKVLLAIDSSVASQSVICEAATRPWPPGTRFCVLHVVDIRGAGRFSPIIEEQKKSGQALVAQVAEKLARVGRETSTEVLIGFPRKTVVQYAKEWGADFVMAGLTWAGSRGAISPRQRGASRASHCTVFR